jgi:hypothetical protein
MLRWRIISGLSIIAVVVLSMALHGSAVWDWAGALIFTGMMAAFAWIAAGEFLNLTKACGVAGFPRLTQIFAVLLILTVGILPVILYGERQMYDQRDGLLLAYSIVKKVELLPEM